MGEVMIFYRSGKPPPPGTPKAANFQDKVVSINDKEK